MAKAIKRGMQFIFNQIWNLLRKLDLLISRVVTPVKNIEIMEW